MLYRLRDSYEASRSDSPSQPVRGLHRSVFRGRPPTRRPDSCATCRPRTTEHCDRAGGNLDQHGVHFHTACVAGV